MSPGRKNEAGDTLWEALIPLHPVAPHNKPDRPIQIHVSFKVWRL
jgi:hypothetical protein